MHWTAFLAYRRFPANARVADDLACIGCGYNLRGLPAGGRCPECGDDVGKSLYVLAKPGIVARDLRMASKGYLAVFALLLIVLGADWTPIVATAIIAIGSIWRAIGLVELYMRGAILRLPVIGTRLRLFCFVSLVECIAAIVQCGLIYWIIKAGWPMWLSQSLSYFTFIWFLALFASTAAAGWFGHSMTTMLGYGWMSIEFRVQQVINVFAMIVALGAALSFRMVNSYPMWITMLILLGLALAFIVVAASLSLMHLANAAEKETETWEDVIETQQLEDAPELPPRPSSTKPEPPAIKLDP